MRQIESVEYVKLKDQQQTGAGPAETIANFKIQTSSSQVLSNIRRVSNQTLNSEYQFRSQIDTFRLPDENLCSDATIVY